MGNLFYSSPPSTVCMQATRRKILKQLTEFQEKSDSSLVIFLTQYRTVVNQTLDTQTWVSQNCTVAKLKWFLVEECSEYHNFNRVNPLHALCAIATQAWPATSRSLPLSTHSFFKIVKVHSQRVQGYPLISWLRSMQKCLLVIEKGHHGYRAKG